MKEIPWKSFDPKIQFLAASARVRPEFMLAYATAALGGISGIRSSIQGLVGEERHPALSLLVVPEQPSRTDALTACVVEPLRAAQDGNRSSNRACGTKLRPSERLPLGRQADTMLSELVNTTSDDDGHIRKMREEYAAETRRCLNSASMIAPSPASFARLRTELRDGHGLIFDPKARILREAFGTGKDRLKWQQLLRSISDGSDFGAEEDSSVRSEVFSSRSTQRSPFLFHVSPRQLEQWWDEGLLCHARQSAMLLPAAKIPRMKASFIGQGADAVRHLKGAVREAMDLRYSGKGFRLDCEFGQLYHKEFFSNVEAFHDRIDDLPESYHDRCHGLMGLPLKLAWTAQLLESPDKKSTGSYAVSAVTAANWCLDQHIELIRAHDEAAEKRKLIQDARRIFARIQKKAPCSFRDVYRGTNSQRRSDVEPAVELLQSENVVTVRGNRIELLEQDTLPEWLSEVCGSKLN